MQLVLPSEPWTFHRRNSPDRKPVQGACEQLLGGSQGEAA